MKLLVPLIEAVAVTALVAIPLEQRTPPSLDDIMLAARNPQSYGSGSGSDGGLGGLIPGIVSIIPGIGSGDNVIANQLDNIRQSVSSLDDVLLSFQGADDAVPLATAASNTLDELKSAISQIQPLSEISIIQAIELLPPVFALQATVDKTVQDLSTKKSTIDEACVGSAVTSVLSDIRDSASNLAQLIPTKLFIIIRPIGDYLAGNIVASLDRALSSFQGDSSPTSCSSGGSSSGSSTYGSGGSGTSTRSIVSSATATSRNSTY